MYGFCPLASGSKGNSIYLGSKYVKILIDAGIGPKILKERLSEVGISLEMIDAILISHEHTDHIKGLSHLACKMGIPVFANSDTAKGICAVLGEYPKFKIFSTGETFEFGDLEIHPFSIQHDTLDPVAFTVKVDGLKLGFCTDLGFPTTLVKTHLRDCDYLYLEANHQVSMVHSSNRPMIYKQRVLGRQGHLSNEACAQLLLEIFHPGLKHVHLAHLSSECNSHDVALKVVQEHLQKEGHEVSISIAYQDKVSRLVSFDTALRGVAQ